MDSIDYGQDLSFTSSLEALKFLTEIQSSAATTCKLVVVSACTQFFNGDGDYSIPWASTAWGLCRTARLEFQSVKTLSVDLSKADNNEIELLTKEIRVN